MSAPEAVVPLIRELARSGIERFRPSYVAQRTGTSVPETHAVLAELAESGELDDHFELVCANSDCHRTIARYESLAEIPLGQSVTCKTCGTQVLVDLGHIWVYYTPSRDFLLRLNRDSATSPEAGRGRKKALTQIMRRLRRLLTLSVRAGRSIRRQANHVRL